MVQSAARADSGRPATTSTPVSVHASRPWTVMRTVSPAAASGAASSSAAAAAGRI